MSLEGFLFLIVALICVVGGITHSVIGERHVLSRLQMLDSLPKHSGRSNSTGPIVRAAWHLISIVWLAIGVLFFLMAQAPLSTKTVAGLLTTTFFAAAIEVGLISRGRHVAWLAFAAIGALAFYAGARFP